MKDLNIKELVDDFRKLYGNDLVSILSINWPDHNLAIIVSENEIHKLSKAFGVLSKWQKKGLDTPFFFTKDYIFSSLDSFPLEFLSFKRHGRIEFGENVLSELNFDKNDIRLQCETELKGKLLLIRRRYLETQGKEKHIVELIHLFMPALIRIFAGLLYYGDETIPQANEEIITKISDKFHVDKDLFLGLLKIRNNKEARGIDVCKLLENLSEELGRLSDIVDKLPLV